MTLPRDKIAARIRALRRILELKPPRPTGKGLIVLHQALIDAAMEKDGIKLENKSERPSRDFDPAYLDGQMAAERVRLDRGLRGPQTTTAFLR